MKPQDAKVIADFLLAQGDQEMALTTRVFQAVPAGRLDYRPDGLSKTGKNQRTTALQRPIDVDGASLEAVSLPYSVDVLAN